MPSASTRAATAAQAIYDFIAGGLRTALRDHDLTAITRARRLVEDRILDEIEAAERRARNGDSDDCPF